MIWVGWREQRTEALIAVGILAAIAVALVPTGIQMAHAYDHDGLAACLSAHPGPGCGDLMQSFQDRFSQISNLLAWLTLLPGLIGVLLAAPFVMQLESGAYRLDWTQSITRGRWIVWKLALAVAAAVVVSVVFIEVVTWWRGPLVHLGGRMDPAVFDSEGIVAVGYTLFALGLALAVGAVWRRAVPALVVGFVAYVGLRLFVDTWLRQHLTPPRSLTIPSEGFRDPAVLRHAWVISERPSDRFGHPIVPHFVAACDRASDVKACVGAHLPHYVHAVYEPAGRFWSMQLVEFGLFAGAAALLIAFAAAWTLKRE